jgi:phage-related protein
MEINAEGIDYIKEHSSKRRNERFHSCKFDGAFILIHFFMKKDLQKRQPTRC